MNKFFESSEMLAEEVTAVHRGFVGRVRLAADELFGDTDDFLLFQGFQVAGQVSVGYAEQFLQLVERQGFVDHERRHDPEPDAAFKYFLKVRN